VGLSVGIEVGEGVAVGVGEGAGGFGRVAETQAETLRIVEESSTSARMAKSFA
jgi:hypothetical protein